MKSEKEKWNACVPDLGSQNLDSLSPKSNLTMVSYQETGDLFVDTCESVESAQSIAYSAVGYNSGTTKLATGEENCSRLLG